MPLPQTGLGCAIRTVHWFLYGKTLAWDYDRMKLKDIIPFPVVLRSTS